MSGEETCVRRQEIPLWSQRRGATKGAQRRVGEVFVAYPENVWPWGVSLEPLVGLVGGQHVWRSGRL